MTLQTINGQVRNPKLLPQRAHKLALRVLQLVNAPGEYQFTLRVDEEGKWWLLPPPEAEEIGP